MKNLRTKIYRLVEPISDEDAAGRIFTVFITTVIITNCIVMFLETFSSLYERASVFFNTFELISVIIFSVEYILRVWSCISSRELKYRKPLLGRLRYMLRPMMIIDLLAVLPFYIVTLGVDLRSIRILRLFRVFRILKLGRYSTSLELLINIIRKRKGDLGITFLMSIVLILLSSFVVYTVEKQAQPDVFINITSALWWAIATLTPGPPAYKFVHPVTLIGKFAAGLIQIIGIAIIALPTGIIGAGFNEELKKERGSNKKVDLEKRDNENTATYQDINQKLSHISSKIDNIERKLKEHKS